MSKLVVLLKEGGEREKRKEMERDGAAVAKGAAQGAAAPMV